MNTDQRNSPNLLTVCSVLERLGVFLCTCSVVISERTGSRECRKFRVVVLSLGVPLKYFIIYYVSLNCAFIIDFVNKFSFITYNLSTYTWNFLRIFIPLPFLFMGTNEYRTHLCHKYYYTHLRIAEIYSAQCGGRLMQTNRCGKQKQTQSLTADRTECSTTQMFTISITQTKFTVSLLHL
jgi:hypothetical protein